MNVHSILAVLGILIGAVVTFRARLSLPAFFLVCYFISFFPLLYAALGLESAFWTGRIFTYSPDDFEVTALSDVCLVSALGYISGMFLGRLWWRKSGAQWGRTQSQLQVSSSVHEFVVAYVAAVMFTGYRVFFDTGNADELLAGAELLNCLLILASWGFAVASGGRTWAFGLCGVVTLAYAAFQLQAGDRDFFIVILAVIVYFMSSGRMTTKNVVVLLSGASAAYMFGVLVSILRMDDAVDLETLQEFTSFNSWNAAILPVLRLIEIEWGSGYFLLGKSYVDIVLSLAPSPLYAILGTQKPVLVDNPAMWFYIEGLGGMHMSGVALRNFGLGGVFLQVLIFTLVLFRVEVARRRSNTIGPVLVFLFVAAGLMHTTWYSLITFFNVGLFALVVLGAVWLVRTAASRVKS